MAMLKPLDVERLCWRFNASELPFETTAELPDLTEVIGQARATEAIRFGLGIRREGYNLFVLGPSGTGRHTIVRRFLDHQASTEPVPPDWCYVFNFEKPHKPLALRLPAGVGTRLQRHMERLVEDLRVAIPAAFEAEEYRARRQEIEEGLKEKHERAFEELRREAESHGITLIRTPGGMAFAPVRKGEVISPADFEKLPEDEQKRISAVISALQDQLERIVHQTPQWKRDTQNQVRELDRQVTMAAVGHLLEELKKEYAAYPAVLRYLDAVQQSVIENADDFKRGEEGAEITFLGIPIGRAGAGAATASLRRYQVNVLVDHSATRGAPVVHEDNPAHPELVGRVEHLAQMGALVTDFTLIKSGALHRANGGYLVLDARKVLMQPYAWEGLKRCLASHSVRIESLGQMLSLVSTVSLEPEPIPLDVKVVLIGERIIYYLLQYYDPDFRDLFKVAADFEEDMERRDGDPLQYSRLIATLARRESLLPFDRAAVARLIEQAARLAVDIDKLTVNMRDLADVLRESDYWARGNGHAQVGREDVQRAIEARIRRADRLRERMYDDIQRGTILIDTQGTRVGQVNGLSVVGLGDFLFGHPSRITARVRLGKGEVLDIQREVELGGPIHSKGVLILSAFLGARYCADRPLSLSASLTFEQTYGEVEGDSASSAELYALLSALAEAPIRQSLAVTGSVNQHGEIQPIGGVNEKVEGFFDVCKTRGLTGDQGVLIPATNVRHLMLRDDVVEACAQGKFHLYPVTTIDEGIALLTGMPSGERDAEGRFPEDSINRRVEERLAVLAELARAYAVTAEITEGGT
jgi:lon-related putative ATP-dependent protease